MHTETQHSTSINIKKKVNFRFIWFRPVTGTHQSLKGRNRIVCMLFEPTNQISNKLEAIQFHSNIRICMKIQFTSCICLPFQTIVYFAPLTTCIRRFSKIDVLNACVERTEFRTHCYYLRYPLSFIFCWNLLEKQQKQKQQLMQKQQNYNFPILTIYVYDRLSFYLCFLPVDAEQDKSNNYLAIPSNIIQKINKYNNYWNNRITEKDRWHHSTFIHSFVW